MNESRSVIAGNSQHYILFYLELSLCTVISPIELIVMEWTDKHAC